MPFLLVNLEKQEEDSDKNIVALPETSNGVLNKNI